MLPLLPALPTQPQFSVQGGLDVIRKEAWPFYRTISGVRLCWELEEPKGPKVVSWSEFPMLPSYPHHPVLSTEGRVVGPCWEKLKPKGPKGPTQRDRAEARSESKTVCRCRCGVPQGCTMRRGSPL